MNHDPQETMINGKPAEWNDEIRKLWALVVAAHFEGETRPTVNANYFTPRPYVDQYNRGSDRSGFTYTVGRDVCQHIFALDRATGDAMTTDKPCPRCFGRGYLPESRKPSKRNPYGLGFYARNCPRCNGRGAIEEKRK